MNGKIILKSKIGDQEMVYPMEKTFLNLPRVGERLDIGDVFGPCATVTQVTHYVNGFYYPGELMRRNGIKSKWGIQAYFRTMLDVKLDEDFYEPHTFETWHGQMGWDKLEWLLNPNKYNSTK